MKTKSIISSILLITVLFIIICWYINYYNETLAIISVVLSGLSMIGMFIAMGDDGFPEWFSVVMSFYFFFNVIVSGFGINDAARRARLNSKAGQTVQDKKKQIHGGEKDCQCMDYYLLVNGKLVEVSRDEYNAFKVGETIKAIK
jgi:hypothetical protein